MNQQHMADEQLDDLVRREMGVLRASVPVPQVDAGGLSRPRSRFVPRDPAASRRLAPAGVAVGLAVLLAVGSGTWYTVQRLHGHSTGVPAATPTPHVTPSPSPSVAPSPAPLPALLDSTVPAGVPVIWYTPRTGQPDGALRLVAVDWSGATRGHMDVPGVGLPPDTRSALGFVQSPDGERLLIGDDVYSSDGHRLYTLPRSATGRVTWGDDSRTMCVGVDMPRPDGNGVDDEVVVLDGNGVERPVTSVLGTTGNDAYYSIQACAVSTDRVVSYVQVSSAATKVQVNRLSSNQKLLDQALCTTGNCGYNLGNISVSAGGLLAAESDKDGNVRIRDLTTGRVRSLSRRGGVLRLSADGTRLLLGRPSFDFSSRTYPLVLLDVATGRVLWTHSEEAVLGPDSGAQPGGSAIAAAYHDIDRTATPGPGGYPPLPKPSTLVLLRNGTATAVAGDVDSLFFGLF